jgi:HK97 family phage portal protein
VPIKQRVISAYQMMRDFIVPNPAQVGNSQTWLMPAQRAEFKNVEPFDNGAVMACLDWTVRNFEQAPFTIYRKQQSGKRKPVTDHPLYALLESPNPYYGGFQLMAATLISYDLNGNAYWLKRRGANGFGLPEELWYVPHWMMRPYTDANSNNFIDHYLYTVNGAQYQVPVEDVVHFRNGLNPNDVREGFSNLRSVLREIYADDESSVFAASILKNMGIPGLIVAPDPHTHISEESAKDIKEKVIQRTVGSERGKPIVLNFAANLTELGMSPVDMNTVEQRMFFEQRVCAVLGIAPAVVNLPSGSKNAQSYNNLVNLNKSAFEQNLSPRWRMMAREVKRQLLPNFPNSAALVCEFDTHEVPALKEAEDARQKRERESYLSGGQSWNEYRTALNKPTDPQGDFYVIPSNVQPVTLQRLKERAEAEPEPMPDPNQPNDQPDANADDPAKHLKKKAYDWDGVSLARKPTELEQKQLGQVMNAQDSARSAMTDTLRPIRARLVETGIPQLGQLDGSSLTLALTSDEQIAVRNAVQAAYQAGRDTATADAGKALEPFEQREKGLLETLARILKVGVAALIARITGRLVDEYARAILRGASPEEAAQQVRAEMEGEPAAYVEEIASGLAYEAVGSGRFDGLTDAKKPGDRFIYSAILDKNTCEVCESDDLKEADDPAKLPHAPNPLCLGRWRCRCMIVIARD